MPKKNNILISEAPLVKGAPILEVPIKKFAKKVNITWADNADLSGFKRVNQEINDKASIVQSSLVLCSKGTVGYGVFAKNFIPKGSYIGVYGSVLNYFNSKEKLNQYCENLDQSYNLGIAVDHHHMLYNAHDRGNITRFINHAPSQETLEQNYIIATAIKQDIAVENLQCKMSDNGGTGIPCFITKRDILPQEELFWNYGDEYWRNLNKSSLLFNKKGEEIDPGLYQAVTVNFFVKNEGVATIPSESLCIFRDNNLGVKFQNITVSSAEELAKKLKSNNCLFSINPQFNRLNIAVAEELYLTPESNAQPRAKVFETFFNEFSKYCASQKAPCRIEFFCRKLNDVNREGWPLDVVIGVSNQEDCRLIEETLAKASILTVNLQNRYIVLPHVNSKHMINQLNKFAPELISSIELAKPEHSVPAFSDFIQEQKKANASISAIKHSNHSLFTTINLALYHEAVTLCKNKEYSTCYAKLNEFIATITEIDKKSKHKYHYAKALSTRATCSHELGHVDAAIGDCNEAISLFFQLLKEDPSNKTVLGDLNRVITELKAYNVQSSKPVI